VAIEARTKRFPLGELLGKLGALLTMQRWDVSRHLGGQLSLAHCSCDVKLVVSLVVILKLLLLFHVLPLRFQALGRILHVGLGHTSSIPPRTANR
jgi:hypothetical protein